MVVISYSYTPNGLLQSPTSPLNNQEPLFHCSVVFLKVPGVLEGPQKGVKFQERLICKPPTRNP